MLSYEDQEYHRRRSEMELDQAVSADNAQSALAHLELARMHRARRQMITKNNLSQLRARHGPPVIGTDKEA